MTTSALPRMRVDGLCLFLALLIGQTAGSYLAIRMFSWVSGWNQAAVFLAVFPLITMLVCALDRWRLRYRFLIVMAATLTALISIHVLRHNLDAVLFFGPCPPAMELLGYGVLAFITFICAGWTQLLLSFGNSAHNLRLLGVALMAFCVVGLAATLANRGTGQSTAAFLLFTIAQLEQHVDQQRKHGGLLDADRAQELSTLLAQAGRETDAESISRWRLGDGAAKGQLHNAAPIDLSRLRPLPWRETMTRIAQRHQLVIVMEAHNAPRHRQWIEQLLPILRDAGFSDYAAEGLAESGAALKERGYPTPSTGFYAAEPHFANLLRRAIDLGFAFHPYEADQADTEHREERQAANLARSFAANPKLKLVVHAGYGHLFKTHRKGEVKMMAEYLWEMTGIEPFCIWQSFHSPEETDARKLAELLNAADGLASRAHREREPVMLAPVPGGLNDIQFRFLSDAVDALVIHPPSKGGPGERLHGFPSTRKRVAGVWNRMQWPVMIGAFKKGEPENAIALDQVMLRAGETEFALWVPDVDYDVRVFGMNGLIPSVISDGSLRLDIAPEASLRPGS